VGRSMEMETTYWAKKRAWRLGMNTLKGIKERSRESSSTIKYKKVAILCKFISYSYGVQIIHVLMY